MSFETRLCLFDQFPFAPALALEFVIPWIVRVVIGEIIAGNGAGIVSGFVRGMSRYGGKEGENNYHGRRQ
jgi:hypothetical protein